MKIRMLDDQLRLRLDRSEVDSVAAGSVVENITHFPGDAQLSYRLHATGDVIDARFATGVITVTLPSERARLWSADDTDVSIRGSVALTAGTLELLIEKDFECLEPRAGESQANRFRNPKAIAD